jgi:hypothetical protein
LTHFDGVMWLVMRVEVLVEFWIED